MNIRTIAPLALAFMLAAPLTSHAALTAYSQDFESLAPAAPFPGNNTALSDDGWLAFANVFNAGGTYLYQYGVAAPNGAVRFSGIEGGSSGLGGPQQGAQQLVVYSDYANASAHGSGQLVQSNVFQQQTVSAGDIGTTWTLKFDARDYEYVPLVDPSTAMAFISIIDPANGNQLSLVSIDMSAVKSTWDTYSVSFTIAASAGQLLHFGFANTAKNYEGSAVMYDNVSFARVPEPSSYALVLGALGLLGLTARRQKRVAHNA